MTYAHGVMQIKKYDSKAAVATTPKAYSSGEDLVKMEVVSAVPRNGIYAT